MMALSIGSIEETQGGRERKRSRVKRSSHRRERGKEEWLGSGGVKIMVEGTRGSAQKSIESNERKKEKGKRKRERREKGKGRKSKVRETGKKETKKTEFHNHLEISPSHGVVQGSEGGRLIPQGGVPKESSMSVSFLSFFLFFSFFVCGFLGEKNKFLKVPFLHKKL
jgi:hypothetical protein